jgi:hypothetical protein
VSKRDENNKFLGYHILVSEISQMLGLCMPWNHMDYSILSEAKKAYHQVVQLYEGYVMEYHSKEDSIEDKWVEDISVQIIPFFHVVGLVF